MTWAADQRQLFIRERLNERGYINRKDIMTQFDISVAQASLDLKRFVDENPKAITYDKTAKRYVKRGRK